MMTIPNLTFPGLPYGTHEGRFDFRSLLYSGASAVPSDKVMLTIEKNKFGSPDYKRLPLAVAFHDELSSQILRGIKSTTVKNRIRMLRAFYAWCDANGEKMTMENLPSAYRSWVEHLLFKVRIEKSIYNLSAYRVAKTIDRLIKPALGLSLGLISTTRLKPNTRKHKALGSEADKQNLEKTFEFGQFLIDIIRGLTTDAVSGALPVEVRLRNGEVLTEFCGVRDLDIEKSYAKPAERQRFIKRRSPIAAKSVFSKRSSIVNLRISCELLIFISQTGMNLSQAANLKKGQFRYQTDGNDVLIYRVYKGRRGGEVEFTAFKEYDVIFRSYLDWLEVLGESEDDRLFPFVYWHKIPATDNLPVFINIIKRCKSSGVDYFGPAALRKTRINWLLRKTRSPDLVAEIAQHSKEVLLSIYEEPHHQVAAIEISKFYQTIDPAVPSTGPGMCVSPGSPLPQTLIDNAYVPDCITPAGCLFCEYQRDLDTEDYVWSLTTYKYLKSLELDRYTPPEKQLTTHPVTVLIDRINQKLAHYSESADYRELWVTESEIRIREGRFHPYYEGLINLMELTS